MPGRVCAGLSRGWVAGSVPKEAVFVPLVLFGLSAGLVPGLGCWFGTALRAGVFVPLVLVGMSAGPGLVLGLVDFRLSYSN